MGKSTDRYLILTLLSGLIMATTGCSSRSVVKRQPPSEPLAKTVASIAPGPAPKPIPSPPATQPNDPAIDPYELAEDAAASAISISSSASSADDWKLVVERWQEAIAQMKAVPTSSRNKAKAKTKVAEYQRQLSTAKQQIARAGAVSTPPDGTYTLPNSYPYPYPTSSDSNSQPGSISRPNIDRGTLSTNAPSGTVFRARIKRREHGIPVIEVLFNGNQTFDMIVDTGASGTLITRQMAAALGVKPFTSITMDTASQKSVKIPIGYVNSIEVEGAVMQRVPVAIAGPDLETGLLGHDFFGDFDVTIKRDVVEFQVR